MSESDYIPCPDCDGTGEIELSCASDNTDFDTETCSTCHGEKRIKRLHTIANPDSPLFRTDPEARRLHWRNRILAARTPDQADAIAREIVDLSSTETPPGRGHLSAADLLKGQEKGATTDFKAQVRTALGFGDRVYSDERLLGRIIRLRTELQVLRRGNNAR